MLQLKADEVGGGIVRRVFNTGGKQMTPGTVLSRDELLSYPAMNRRALVEKNYIDVFPANPSNPVGTGKGERFVISAGFGRFFVIEGKKLNDEAITREEAYALCGTEPPKAKGRKKQ